MVDHNILTVLLADPANVFRYKNNFSVSGIKNSSRPISCYGPFCFKHGAFCYIQYRPETILTEYKNKLFCKNQSSRFSYHSVAKIFV